MPKGTGTNDGAGVQAPMTVLAVVLIDHAGGTSTNRRRRGTGSSGCDGRNNGARGRGTDNGAKGTGTNDGAGGTGTDDSA